MFRFAAACLTVALGLALVAGAGALIEPAHADPAARPGSPRPNFIIFIADDMAHDDAGAYGHPHIQTPNIDRLAREGMRFDSAFLTCSSCSPSRASINTGRYPHATGASELHMPIPAEQVLLSTPLREAGYWTAAVGKWHMGNEVRSQYDLVVDRDNGPSGCERWVETLRERPADRPFFLYLAAVDPHRPYAENIIPNPHRPEHVVVPPYLPDVPETRQDLAQYYDEITRLDSFVGEVIEELARQNVLDQTFIVFMSDNGRPFPRDKTTVYDSGVKTPFIVRYPPLVGAGSTNGNLVSAIDIAPTFFELAGVGRPTSFQGRSFAPLLGDAGAKIRDYVFAEHNWHDYTARKRSARSTRYLYIRNEYPDLNNSPPADAVRSITYEAMRSLYEAGKLPPHQSTTFIAPAPAEELYDVVSDPHQLRNLAGDPAHAVALREMRLVMDVFQQETDDVAPAERRADGFDRRTGERLDAGAGKGAVKGKAKGK